MAENKTYRWNGAQHVMPGAVTRPAPGRVAYANKGIQRARRAARRENAETRNARTRPENRRQFARDHGYPRKSVMHAAGVFPIVEDRA